MLYSRINLEGKKLRFAEASAVAVNGALVYLASGFRSDWNFICEPHITQTIFKTCLECSLVVFLKKHKGTQIIN